MAARKWTLEQRRAQSERIRDCAPWKPSTGPRTSAVKTRTARNAWKGGKREALREIRRLLRRQPTKAANWL